MSSFDQLNQGYQNFRNGAYSHDADAYRTLGETGQSPHTLVISCCDSRVDPTVIFDAAPGELFVVRSVANLVPPADPDGHHHGTDAALEFGVTGLNIPNIMVMGHAKCGGISAFLGSFDAEETAPSYVGSWISILDGVEKESFCPHHDTPQEEQQRNMEQVGVKRSLDNLMTFDFIAERVAAGTLTLHGAYFDIASGEVHYLNQASGEFAAL
jgi:carbonic anhydrase